MADERDALERRLDAGRKYLESRLRAWNGIDDEKALICANALNELNGAAQHPVVETPTTIEKPCGMYWKFFGYSMGPCVLSHGHEGSHNVTKPTV